MAEFNKGDYVYIKKIGNYGEEISYISILENYDEEKHTASEIASVWAEDTLPDECYELMYYHSTTENIVEIRLATDEEEKYLDNCMYEDGIKFDKILLKLIQLY